jgi:hypothetical protein
MSASAFELLKVNHKMVKVKMVEDGPILLWSDGKIPTSENFEFTKLEDGLWRGELTLPDNKQEYVISILERKI